MATEEKHRLGLPSGSVEVRCAEDDAAKDEIWIADGACIFSVNDWEKATKFVDRVRNF